MKTVGVFHAKTHFSALIDDAERGETTLVTRNGKPVARIVPADVAARREFGFDDGLGFISDDFDAPLPDDVLATFYEWPICSTPTSCFGSSCGHGVSETGTRATR
jgi:prevent-host-death family protein